MFTDSFNRSNETLETSANWTRVGGTAGALEVNTNRLRCTTTGSETAYQAPDQGSADHYVQATLLDVGSYGAGASFLSCRLADDNNFVGVRWTGSAWSVFRRFSGSFTSIGSFASPTPSSGSVVKLQTVGSNYELFHNGTSVGTGAISATMTSTRTGIVARSATQDPYLDDFETGSVVSVSVNVTGQGVTVFTDNVVTALPSYRSHSNTSYASRVNTTITAPSGLANGDILLLTLFLGGTGTPPVPTPPAGFVSVGIGPTFGSQGGFDGYLYAWWKRASGESGSYVVTHSTASTQGAITCIKDTVAAGNPFDAMSVASGYGATATASSITTIVENALLIWASHDWEGLGALTAPTGMTERFDSLVYIADQRQQSAGATGTRTQTNANVSTGAWGAYLFAIKPYAGGVVGEQVTVSVGDVYVDAGQPVHRSNSSVTYGSRTNTTITAPAGIVDGDILLLSLFLGSSGTPTPTPPSGFASVGVGPSFGSQAGFNGWLYQWWKRAASESGSYTTTHATCSSQGVITCIKDAIQTGNPIDAVSVSASSSTGTVSTASSITTTVAGDLLIWGSHDWTATKALNPPAGMTERFDDLVYMADERLRVAGATGARTQTNGNPGSTDVWAAFLIAIKPRTASPDVTVNVTGEVLTASVSTVTVTTGAVNQSVDVTGQSVTVSQGEETVVGKASVTATTNVATVSVDNVTVVGKSSVTTTTNVATALVNDVTVVGKAVINLIGEIVTVLQGSVTVTTDSGAVNVYVDVTGQFVTVSVGTVSVDTGAAPGGGRRYWFKERDWFLP